MVKSLPKIIMVLTLVFSSLLMFNTVNNSTSNNDYTQEISFRSSNEIIDNDLLISDFKTTPYEPSFKPQAARTGAQSFVVLLVHFSDYVTPRWSQAEHEDIMQTIDDYWVNASNGLMSIDWAVEGWYDLGNNLAHYAHLDAGALDLDVNWHTIATEAVALADGDVDFAAYDNIIIMLSNVWWRGVSTLGTKVAINTADGNFNREATLVSERDGDTEQAVWGRVAHEMGHCFLLQHTHGNSAAKNYASYYSLMARAYPSACNIYTMLIDDYAGWFDAPTNQEVIAAGQSLMFHVRPRHLDTTLDVQSLKIPFSATKYYRVEVIEQKSEDAWLPDEGVLIYLVDEGDPTNDQCTDEDSTPGSDPNAVIDLLDCLYDVGQTFTDATNDITISIDQFSFDGYDISVTNDAGGSIDLMINEWGDPPGSPGPWESIDIYVDNPVNGWGWYRYNDGNGHNPVGNGDDPLLNHENRLYAKIHNIGDTDASSVTVKFYENTPIGAGASGTWNLIDTLTGIYVNKLSTLEVFVPWTPTYAVSPTDTGVLDMHSCVKVVIDTHPLEDTSGNNDAQENIDFFEVAPGSPMPGKMYAEATYGSVSKDFTIVNPWKETKEIHINVLGVTGDWTVTGNGIGEFHTFASNEAKVFSIQITPGPDARVTESVQADLVASTNVMYENENGTFDGDMHLTPFGGVSFSATIMYRSSLNIDATIRDENHFLIKGELDFLDDIPQQSLPEADGDRMVYLLVEEVDTGVITDTTVVVDPYGDFQLEVSGKPGLFAINAYYAGTGIITCSASVTLMVDLNASTVWTSTTTIGGFIPGFTFIITLSGIIPICVIVIVKRKRKLALR
ncbi:MAG: hypothetical protein ACTSPM_04440 [Candidatus Heimdallarchaeota archaeon]